MCFWWYQPSRIDQELIPDVGVVAGRDRPGDSDPEEDIDSIASGNVSDGVVRRLILDGGDLAGKRIWKGDRNEIIPIEKAGSFYSTEGPVPKFQWWPNSIPLFGGDPDFRVRPFKLPLHECRRKGTAIAKYAFEMLISQDAI